MGSLLSLPSRLYFDYIIWSGLYMLDWWERALFNFFALLGIYLCFYYASRFEMLKAMGW